MSATGTQVVERVDIAERDRILRRDRQELISLFFQIVSGVLGNNPVGRTDVARLLACDRLDRLSAAIHISQDPLLTLLPLSRAQLDVAVSVVFELKALLYQLMRRIQARHSDVLFRPGFSPRLRSQPPSHDKERSLHSIAI